MAKLSIKQFPWNSNISNVMTGKVTILKKLVDKAPGVFNIEAIYNIAYELYELMHATKMGKTSEIVGIVCFDILFSNSQ